MFPILFHVGTRGISSYSALLDLGLLAGLAMAFWLSQRRKIAAAAFMDAASLLLLGGVLGARLGYVIANWAYFASHLAEAPAIWQGGMSLHGGVLGGLLGFLLYARWHPGRFWSLADAFAAGAAMASIFGWIGCLGVGCAYGIVGKGPLFFLAPDIYGLEAPRFATQPLAAAGSLAILVLLLALWRLGTRPGLLFAGYLLLYFGGQFALGFMRGDEALMLGAWRLTQLVDAALALAGAGLLVLLRQPAATTVPDTPAPETPARPAAEGDTE